jgi:hypothetical protein
MIATTQQNLNQQFPNFPSHLLFEQTNYELYQRLSSIEVDPTEITLTQTLGEGFFGTVYKGNKMNCDILLHKSVGCMKRESDERNILIFCSQLCGVDERWLSKELRVKHFEIKMKSNSFGKKLTFGGSVSSLISSPSLSLIHSFTPNIY